MRIALVSHGFPPVERTGVENYTEALARELARRGHGVAVFAPRRWAEEEHLRLRCQQREGFSVHWVAVNRDPEGPQEALDSPPITRLFGRFLEHERPDVVHFQHVWKLGIGLLREAADRHVPTLYTAHDYFAVCHRYTLTRPDLSYCDVRGDSMACARCDLALGHLNSLGGLGDYQIGVLREQLDEERWRALADILAGEPEAAGFDREVLDAAFELRRRLDARRAEAFGTVDRILAPSERMAEELVRGGLERERVEVLPYGIATGDLRDVPALEAGASRPVRFGYLGGLSKHKGVHVLLDAFGRLEEPAELQVWGYSSDAPYVEHLRAEAARVGARWCGPYEREDLPRLLGDVDVVVVPSLWVENQPIVIREAFGARRPVITSRFGAMPESVRDGVDGLLFEVGDAASLAEALRRCTDRGLVLRLAAGISPVKGVAEQADELLERYSALVAARRRAGEEERARLPAALVPFVERFELARTLPTRELLRRALDGLSALRPGLDPRASATDVDELLRLGLASGSAAQRELRDVRDELVWLRRRAEDAEGEREWLRDERRSVARERDWLSQTLAERERELSWLRRSAKEKDGELGWLRETGEERERELAWLRESSAAKDEELVWRRDLLNARDEELAWLRKKLEELEAEHARLEAEHAELEGGRERLESALEGIRGELQAHREELARSERAARSTADIGLTAMQAQERLLSSEVAPVLDALEDAEEGGSGARGDERPAGLEELLVELRRAVTRARSLQEELVWRREEMRRAVGASRRRVVRVLLSRTGLGRRLAGWEDEEEEARP